MIWRTFIAVAVMAHLGVLAFIAMQAADIAQRLEPGMVQWLEKWKDH